MLELMIVLLFAFGFGGMLLIVVFGARGIEEQLEARARADRDIRTEVARMSRFLVTNRIARPPVGRMDEAMLSRVRQYLEAEQMVADEFVLQPSVESLYRDSGTRLTVH
jgi:hypothetical protein